MQTSSISVPFALFLAAATKSESQQKQMVDLASSSVGSPANVARNQGCWPNSIMARQ